MKRPLLLLFVLYLTPLAAVAKDHGLFDALVHLEMYAEAALFWLKQGEIVMAFNQPLCYAGDSASVWLTHLIFAQGGGLWVSSLLISLAITSLVFRFRRKATKETRAPSYA